MGCVHTHACSSHLSNRVQVLRLEVRVGARTVHGRAPHLPRQRKGSRRIEFDQRNDISAWESHGLRTLGGTTRDGAVGLRPLPAVFQRMETTLAGEDEYRGGDGPLVLERGPATNPLFQAFFKAGEQAGHPNTTDVNGYRQEGFAPFDANRVRGRRLSAARAYLHPAMRRPNLTVITRAHTTRILFDGNRAVGVEYRKRGKVKTASGADIIACGGAINSPQLLMLSGVGPRHHLESLGIDVVADVRGVGQNLQDHLEVYIQYTSKKPVSMQPYLAKWRMPIIGFSGCSAAVLLPPTTSRAEASCGATTKWSGPTSCSISSPLPSATTAPCPRADTDTRCTSADALRRAGRDHAEVDRPVRQAGSALQLPLDRERSPRVDRGGPHCPPHSQPAGL